MNLIKIIPFYIFLLSCSGIVNAQILDNRKGEIFSDETFFSEEFIQKNRIKKISGRIRTKRVNEIIKDDRQVEMYTFNQGGLQTGYLKTYNAKGKKKDTSFMFYNYNDGRITMKRGNDRQGFFSHSFRRDDVGNIISEEYRREANTTADKSNYIPGKEYVIYTEKRSVEMRYVVVDKSGKKEPKYSEKATPRRAIPPHIYTRKITHPFRKATRGVYASLR